MRWYDGSITEAVAASKKNGAIFVVFLEGSDGKSQELKELIDDREISSRLECEHFVAINVEANTTPHHQFRQIYHQATVPSLFFIGKNGKPLEIVVQANGVEFLKKKIDTILESNGYDLSKIAVSSTTLLAEEISTSQLDLTPSRDSPSEVIIPSQGDIHLPEPVKISPNQDETTPSEPDVSLSEPHIVCEGNVCTLTLGKASSSKEGSTSSEIKGSESKDSTPSTLPDDKIEKALKLMEQIREAKEAEEKEKERMKELERRKTGQDVQKLRRWQEDEDLKHIIEEKEREKREQKAARDRILQQIAQDKVDRATKFGNMNNVPSASQLTQPQPVRRPAASANSARLQFKLPDGTSHTRDFSSSDTLLAVRNYITANVHLPFQNYLLSTAFPRREFTNSDDGQSLSELELVPNAVILILPMGTQGVVRTRNSTGVSGMLWTIFSPLFNIFGYLKNYIFGTALINNTAGGGSAETSRNPNKRPSDTSTGGESSRYPMKRRAGGSKSSIRQEGNIHRLSDPNDDDDENNTWNGNSTQQM